ncbi:hypothetical protein [Calothrix sp. UHCC 0171]|uniref:hypothetical protein n=1 Tax=Calothrix sp. UHCC 0171 TaxID=3110245 RepID=UPI002B201338|nr:hypothetical protein [Calothrix sp. UHCC 0171]MEA5572171.1 hypothetical protein [Calothrix sp. UHCC 0171]
MCEENERSLINRRHKIKGKKEKIPEFKCLTSSHLTKHELEVFFVKLETIYHILFAEKNQKLVQYNPHSETLVTEQLSNLKPGFERDISYLKSEKPDLHIEKARIMNILLKFTDDDDLQREGEHHDIDETLLWLIKEYIRLSSLPSLNEAETQRMLSILELAQIDTQLDEWISRIDTALVAELGLTEEFPETTISTEKVCNLSLDALTFKTKLNKCKRYNK